MSRDQSRIVEFVCRASPLVQQGCSRVIGGRGRPPDDDGLLGGLLRVRLRASGHFGNHRVIRSSR
jgi:hypothetical protein